MSTSDPRDPHEDPQEEPADGQGPARHDRPADDIDAEFARLTESLSLDEEPLTVEDVLSDGTEDDQEPTIAVVATSVASATALAGAIRLGREARTDGIDIPTGSRTLDTRTGAIAVGALTETAAHDLSAIASAALQRNGIVLFWRRGDRMTATRYRNGQRGEEISPAIVLGAVDDVVEELLLGATELGDLDEGIDPATITRAEALSWIAGKGKRT